MRRWLADRFETIYLIVAVPVVILMVVVLQIIPATVGGQQNYFQTLRSDLAKIRLPPGYRLTAEHKTGTDCANEDCSLTQTWTWVPALQPAGSSACSDVFNAMNSAVSQVGSNSPIPANAACDYDGIVDSLFHPQQGKRSIEAIVQTGNDRTGEHLKVTISATSI